MQKEIENKRWIMGNGWLIGKDQIQGSEFFVALKNGSFCQEEKMIKIKKVAEEYQI